MPGAEGGHGVLDVAIGASRRRDVQNVAQRLAYSADVIPSYSPAAISGFHFSVSDAP